MTLSEAHARQTAALRELADAVYAHDHHQPFNDHTWTEVERDRAVVITDVDLVLTTAIPLNATVQQNQLLGAAILLGDEFELAVRPEARGHGLGRRLLRASIAAGGRAFWSHGALDHAVRLANDVHAHRTRDLLLLHLPAEQLHDLTEPALPADVSIRAFRVGVDEDAWLAVNAAAFATHPEQGDIDIDELRSLQSQPWFSADDVLLLWHGDELIGFNWTKVAPAPDGEPEGEIYAIGVRPDAAGHGYGRILMQAGLSRLRARTDDVTLYVEADNEPALHLYRALGFVERSRDIHWRVG